MESLTLEEVVERSMLQELIDTMADLTTVTLYCATPAGKVLAKSGELLTACSAMVSSENAPRPCLKCLRKRLNPLGEGWHDGDLGEQLPCLLGLRDVVVPVRVDDQVVGVVGSVQVACSSAMKGEAKRRLERLGKLDEESRRFLKQVPHRDASVMKTAQSAVASMTSLFARMGRMVRQEQVLRGRFERLSQVDPLTGVENRRQAAEAISHARRESLASGQPLSLLMLDLDRFKRINDTCGHAAGDAVLRGFSEVVRSVIRTTDRFFRMGGEEFVVLCEGCDVDSALSVAERIRAATGQAAFPEIGELAPMTVSIGVYSSQGASLLPADGMLEAADLAMYEAKQEGRNRVVLAEPLARSGAPGSGSKSAWQVDKGAGVVVEQGV